jgi:hypothetical protein
VWSHRTRGNTRATRSHGQRLDIGQLIKPFVFLDLVDTRNRLASQASAGTTFRYRNVDVGD